MDIAIITGASSGMGKEFALTLHKHGKFDEVWLIARREERLNELAKLLPFKSKIFAWDLTDPSVPDKFAEVLSAEKPNVKLLINCSGFGKFDKTDNIPLEVNMNMTDLNCKAVLFTCQLALPYMSKGSKIINIASVAALQPIPYINVYGATKAFVLSFSRALNREVKKEGITVTAVCPFWTKTEFFDRAVRSKEKENAIVKKYTAMYDVKDIVKRAYRDSERGKDVSKYGFIARAQALLVKILPHSLVMSIWQNQQKLK